MHCCGSVVELTDAARYRGAIDLAIYSKTVECRGTGRPVVARVRLAPPLCLAPAHSMTLGRWDAPPRPQLSRTPLPTLGWCCQFSLELWQEMLTEFIIEKSKEASEQWVVMGNSIGGLLTLMLTESLQGGRKVRVAVRSGNRSALVGIGGRTDGRTDDVLRGRQ